jgi:hypothetical protein
MITLEQLQSAVSKLGDADRPFASDLAAKWDRNGSLTVRQMYWAEQMVQRATAPAKRDTVNVGDFSGVMNLFSTARAHLKHPKITLQVGAQPLALSLAGPNSKAPGTVNVTDGGRFGSNQWFGRVSPNGSWEKSRQATPQVEAFLLEFSKAPAAVAKKYGRLTGRCCFCNKALTDAKSTAAGFGPVCADHFGLTAEWKAAVGVLEQEAA